MQKIKQLSEDVVSKIAAGEVIERPAYAVKELIENSLDAKADTIMIEIEKSGLQKIVVLDNGEGMSREDLKICFYRHCTSKIQTENDLQIVKSFGFRGEALSSILAMGDMVIKSRTRDSKAGMALELLNGKLHQSAPVGMPVGTQIIVDNLFSPVPARQKFLKSASTEFRHIVQIVVNNAIAFPHIRFYLSHNNHPLIDLPKNESINERLLTLLGSSTVGHLIPISYKNTYIEINGFISKPQLSTHTASKQYLFINERSIKSKLISSAIKEAYGTLLNPTAQPVCIFFIKLPYEMVDVNVHPRKEEVNFHNESFIFEEIKQAVAQTLANNNLTFFDSRWQKSKKNVYKPSIDITVLREGNTQTYAADLLRDDVLSSNNLYVNIKKNAEPVQINNVYILIETDNGLLIIDQHAAHERILYEQFIQAFKKRKEMTEQYVLKNSVMFAVSIEEKELIQEHIEFFQKAGFDISLIDTVKISAVPVLFKDRNIEEIVKEMIEDLAQNAHIKDVDSVSQRMLTYLACRSAIKSGDELTKAQMKGLIDELQRTKNQYTCPHGRPTQFKLTTQELLRFFRRSR